MLFTILKKKAKSHTQEEKGLGERMDKEMIISKDCNTEQDVR